MRWPIGAALLVAALGDSGAAVARAGITGRAARELAEWALRRSGRQATREGAEALARRIEALAARHGDAVVTAIRKAGPEAVRLVERAGGHGGLATKLLARHGEEAAWVAAQ